jgi:hypothetical protein
VNATYSKKWTNGKKRVIEECDVGFVISAECAWVGNALRGGGKRKEQMVGEEIECRMGGGEGRNKVKVVLKEI